MVLTVNFFLSFLEAIKDLFGLLICCGTPLILIAAIFYQMHKSAIQKEEERKQYLLKLEEVRNNYYKSLEKLKLNSTDADLKQLTLQLGRTYAEMTRQFEGINGVTLFDEVKLMNDINAACAGATFTSPNIIVTNSVEERLAKLFELKEKNLISGQEYEERRLKILDTI